DGEHQQRCRHRPLDEQAGGVHGDFVPASPAFLWPLWRWPPGASPPAGGVSGLASASRTAAPSRSRSTPSITTRSPASRPLVITVWAASDGPVFTWRASTVLPSLTT